MNDPIPIDTYEKLEREVLDLPLRDRLLLASLLLESLDNGAANIEADENEELTLKTMINKLNLNNNNNNNMEDRKSVV